MTKRMLPLLLLVVSLGATPACRAETSRERTTAPHLRVLKIRPARPDETPFTQRHPLLSESGSANDAPGPDSTRLRVRSNANHKPSIYLENPRTGQSRLLIERASSPRAAPNGRYVACSIWKSRQRPVNLLVLDLKTGRRIEPVLDGCTTAYRWSPDGKYLAAMVTACQEPLSRLCFVEIPSAKLRWADTLGVFSDYEFAWSPDSRLLAVVRPTAVNASTEEPIASDIWLFSQTGRRKDQLTATPDFIEHAPGWLTNRALLVERIQYERGQPLGRDRVVLELKEE